MGELAGISGKEAVRRFVKLGYIVARQKGSHVRLIDPTGYRGKLSVPLHRELRIGLLKRLIRDAKSTPKEFLDY
ncbi:MAG: type II toxin-antitoxin system HicA family toxin [Patescibacteria group bacterium]